MYEGPLDLLLDLIERAELDITTIALATVTDQYLNYIHTLEHARADDISAFLVIAAKLLQIKSEALLPRPPEREPGEEDTGQELVEQLRLYKRFKEVGAWLEERQDAGLRAYLRVAPQPKVKPKLDLSSLTLEGLFNAALSAYQKEQEKRSLGTVIAAPKVTIREKIELIARILKQVERSTFKALIQSDKATRIEIVVTFLALLELIKRYRVSAYQETLFGDIEFERMGNWDESEELELEFE